VCAGLLSLALIYCHLRKSNQERSIAVRELALKEIEVDRQRMRLEQERSLIASGVVFKRDEDKINEQTGD
jgi:hypothetical protein